jgi:hypothetical protein
MPRNAAEPVLDEKWTTFVQGGVSIVAAAGDSRNHPTIVRAVGCRISTDRRKVTVLVSPRQAEKLLVNIRSTGRIAVIFAQPSTHVSIQVKGSDARLTPLRAGDAALVERYAKAFCADLCPLGYEEALIRALVWCDPADLVAVTFTAENAWLQTPGPNAGEALRKQA